MHTIFPHPTLSEMMKEAVLDAYGRVLKCEQAARMAEPRCAQGDGVFN